MTKEIIPAKNPPVSKNQNILQVKSGFDVDQNIAKEVIDFSLNFVYDRKAEKA